MSTTEAGTPVLEASGYPHTDGDTTQLWVDGPAVPPPGAGLELVLVAVLVGGVLLLAAVLLVAAELVAAELLVGAELVALTVLVTGAGVLDEAVERTGRCQCRQGPAVSA